MKVARRAVNFYRWELWDLMRMQTSCCGIKGSLQELGKPCASVKMGGRQGFLPGVGILNGIWAAEGAHRDAGACGSVGADHGPRSGGSWFTSLPWLWMLCLHLEPMPLLSSCHQTRSSPSLIFVMPSPEWLKLSPRQRSGLFNKEMCKESSTYRERVQMRSTQWQKASVHLS